MGLDMVGVTDKEVELPVEVMGRVEEVGVVVDRAVVVDPGMDQGMVQAMVTVVELLV